MRKYAYIIGGIILVLLLMVFASWLGALAEGQGFRVFQKAQAVQEQANKLYDESNDILEKARIQYCDAYNQTKASCLLGYAQACASKDLQQKQYSDSFGVNPEDHCIQIPAPGTVLASGEIVESETGIPEQNPLFFGDEGSK
mgnify:CR=1 FL=1